MNRFKKSLITIKELVEWLEDKRDKVSFEDIMDGILNGMTLILSLVINIILFPLVIVRYIKGIKNDTK